MLQEIEEIKSRIGAYSLASAQELENFKREISGKNGAITSLFDRFKSVPNEEKRAVGQALNELKNLAQEVYTAASEKLESQTSGGDFDFTLPGALLQQGTRHPLNVVGNEIIGIFERIGFTVEEGPEVEDDWHNFTALNFPEEHPARDMQDTFFVEHADKILLRTHTSSVQVRTMMRSQPPLRVISPGRVYRCDSDATHSPVFHQVEGLYIDKGVSFSDLKDVLFYFVRSCFGTDIQVRFRPSYFPFTEPSAEMDIGWTVDGKFKWMEILGCGMVDPHVLNNCGIDSSVYSGYAFGMGVERITMLRHKIKDIRLFYENDLRFLNQF